MLQDKSKRTCSNLLATLSDNAGAIAIPIAMALYCPT